MNRRNFLLSAAGGLAMAGLPARAAEEQRGRAAPAGASGPAELLNVFGPRAGFSPQIGLLVSMMSWMRAPVLRSAQGLTTTELDFLLDAHANSIGAMLLHLAATERYYQLNTFENMKWGSWSKQIKDRWDVAMGLGEPARKSIKGHELRHYVDALAEVREHTLSELRKRDDPWLAAVDETWPWGPTNNWCKWFHVVEHESNHNGQIKLIRKRLPGAKPSGGD